MYRNKYKIVNKRRFFVSVIVLLLLAMSIFSLIINITVQASEFAAKKVTEVYVVQEGDTLWDIAAKAESKDDIREIISIIKKENNLASDEHIQPGQVLYLSFAIDKNK